MTNILSFTCELGTWEHACISDPGIFLLEILIAHVHIISQSSDCSSIVLLCFRTIDEPFILPGDEDGDESWL